MMQKREAQQLIEMLDDGKVESVMYLLRGVVSDYEGEEAAAKERQEYEEMSDADKAAYDAYHGDAAGWLAITNGWNNREETNGD